MSIQSQNGRSLTVEGLRVCYGALVALDGVSFTVRPGEILGIIGPNGAGKSTCYNATTHMVGREGRVFIDDEDVTEVPAHKLAGMGLRRAFQQNTFFSDISVLGNMIAVIQHDYGSSLGQTIFRPLHSARRAAEARDAARAALIRMGVPENYHDSYPTQIPYGTQRSLSIALANATGAGILLLDEPAAGLGGEDMQKLVALMKSLRDDGVALVVIEHHMDLIMSVTDQIVVLDQGRMIASGTPSEIRNSPEVLEAYLGRSE
ncbi:ABC transporter ATP-binding protein [Anianabacter salinae]|uniref:ABC transporter ATP-binding protein n=1 Tax=Anianabacter salinae TaxID=2851023 RepID=UPI00225E5874|nr:ATP-binding cassette domain-containing protein [Anianabacter salinae]MBV0911850.1 ATP-binding cassette domain-containing protein [Anianabacter salinae]